MPHLPDKVGASRRLCVLVLCTQRLPFAMLRAGARANLFRTSGAKKEDEIDPDPGPGLKPVSHVRAYHGAP